MPDSQTLYIGIDLGGTNIQAGLVTPDGEVLARDKTKTKAELGPEGVVGRIAKLVLGLLKDRKLGLDDVSAVGIGAPGAVDVGRGVVIEAVNLRWRDTPLRDMLASALGNGIRPEAIHVDNDVNVGTWGEYRAGGLERGVDALGVFVGTGIGGGLVLNGHLYRGARGTAGEIGHLWLDADARLGDRTLENRASRTAIVDQIVRLVKASHPSAIVDLCEGDFSKVRSKVLATAYEQQDPLAREVIDTAARTCGVAIANQVTMLSLGQVVLGGGLLEALGEDFAEHVRAAFVEAVFPFTLRDTPIHVAALGDDAGLVGAALLSLDLNSD